QACLATTIPEWKFRRRNDTPYAALYVLTTGRGAYMTADHTIIPPKMASPDISQSHKTGSAIYQRKANQSKFDGTP
ncbi:MAG: hypothetical protein ACXABD_13340, partial [Candidatus Thorarchaeota archaeon]